MPRLDLETAQVVAQNIKNGNFTIRIAPTVQVEAFRAEVDEIVEALGSLRGLKDIWVSDASPLAHFNPSVAELELLCDRFGIEFEADSLICELAARLRQKRSNPHPDPLPKGEGDH